MQPFAAPSPYIGHDPKPDELENPVEFPVSPATVSGGDETTDTETK